MRGNALPTGNSIAEAPRAANQSANTSGMVEKLVRLCALGAYALLGLGLRLVMARVFFISGQAKIEGPDVPIYWSPGGIDFSVTLPAGIKDTTFQMFERQYADLPMAPGVAASMLLQVYVAPAMWWSLHVYWVSILMVLVLCGPGAISIDALIRTIYRRDRRLARG